MAKTNGKNGGEAEIKFPVTFNFKAMMDATINDDTNKEKLVEAFDKYAIEYLYEDKKISSKGTYVSFTYKITILNRPLMNDFYAHLKTIDSLKFAL